MKSNYKARQIQNERVELTRANLKLFLIALMRSEGFGEQRLKRVLYEFCELANNTEFDNDEMMIVDKVLEDKLGKDIISNIGFQKFEK